DFHPISSHPCQAYTKLISRHKKAVRLISGVPGDWRRGNRGTRPDCARWMSSGKPASIHRVCGSAPRLGHKPNSLQVQ
ncbi:MAG: hypothetical protein KAV87_52960, partial [Desulfobacteraceae bacterium]|nr:hypothetical protein [Desulfobacteraceae bacterium]